MQCFAIWHFTALLLFNNINSAYRYWFSNTVGIQIKNKITTTGFVGNKKQDF